MKQTKTFPWRLFSRIVLIQAALVLVALLVSGLAARHLFKRQFISQVEDQLHLMLGSLSQDLDFGNARTWCKTHSYDPSFRLTIISADGTVLCDSHHDPRKMENHLGRPEVQAALGSGFGESIRFSSTLSENMVYGALAIKAMNLVLRGAMPLSQLARTLRVFDASLAVFLVLTGLASVVFAAWSGRRLAFPIGRLVVKAKNLAIQNHESALSRDEPFGELSELESSLDNIRDDLEAKAESLLREREEQATLMSAISDAILAVDLESGPLFYNSRFALSFAHPKKIEPAKARLWELFREPEILDAFRDATRDGKLSSVEAVAIGLGAETKYFSVSIAPLRRGSSGEVYGAVGVFHDVTELKRAEQIRIDFVANVSHELRTPLTSIKGYADTLSQDLERGSPIAKEIVDVIERNTARLTNLINDLLDLSSIESHADEIHVVKLSTEQVSGRVVRQLQGIFESKRLAVEVRTDASHVFADAGRLEQVLVNLLDNAGKYTPIGGRITLAWHSESEAVLLKVSDTGPGIPAEHQARLFERFYRVDKARSRELGGTGLGLAIVKHIMQRHGGSVWVESVPGRGAIFVCRFPNVEYPSAT